MKLFEKKYKIDDLYFAKMGNAELVCVKEGIFEKKFYPKTYVCIKLIYSDNESSVFEDVLNGSIYKFFGDDKKGEYCLSKNSLKPLRSVFKHQNFKVVNKKIIKGLIEEFNKNTEERNSKQLALEVCKLNKIKIVKNENLDKNEIL